MCDINLVKEQSKTISLELIDKAKLKKGDVVVIGCSTSEIIGSKIGTNSSYDTAKEVFATIYHEMKSQGIYVAAQCCEHLNRAIIIENELRERLSLDAVNVVPQPKAGGSFATCAYENFEHPCAVEHIKCDAGIDIGSTLIGMHLKDVAVPLRLSIDHIGDAYVVFARTRPKFIGGVRAHYNEDIM